MTEKVVDRRLVDAMKAGTPLKRYKKTILGKVYVTALNPFSDEPEGIILQGNPANPDELDEQVVEIWDERQDLFFRKINKKHFEAGRLIELAKVFEEPRSPNEVSDEELDRILGLRFLAFKNRIEKFTEEAPLFRLINRARDVDKSEKIVKHLEETLSKVQYKQPTAGG